MARCRDCLCYDQTQGIIEWWLWCLLPVVIVLILLAAAILMLLHFAIIPHVLVSVTDARLDTFTFTTTQESVTATPLFHYNISVALWIRNPNNAMSIKHSKPFLATFAFHNRRLHNLTVLDEGHKHRPGKKELLPLHATGQIPSFRLGDAAAEDFKIQNATGLFKIELRLSGEITYQGIGVAKKPKLSVSCPLELQLAPPGSEIIVFPEVNCKPVAEDKVNF
ncbi:hypothetical protein ACP70R_021467 [Stipagrostis hirtigluma subsp. patula]